jgi:hypothetical protein
MIKPKSKIFTPQGEDKYEGPFFPEMIDELNEIYQSNGRIYFSPKELAIAGEKIHKGYVLWSGIVTEDGYFWHCGLHFETPEGEVLILLPNRKWEDESYGFPPRSIAVHTKGTVGREEINRILTKFKRVLLEEREKKTKAHEIKASRHQSASSFY